MDILAAVGDLHCNSKHALMPPSFVLQEGATVLQSEIQRWIWDKWGEFWSEVESIKRYKNARLVTLVNGEICDVNKYNNVELISSDPEDAMQIGMAALEVPAAITDDWVVSYGTEAHVGTNGLLDRVIANRMGMAGDHWNRFDVGGLRVDAMHHPKMNNRVKWTTGAAAMRMSLDLEIDYLRRGWPLPHLAIRGHVHAPQDSGDNHSIRMEVLPSWKLSDSFVSRIGEAFPAPIGGAVFWLENDRLEYRRFYYRWPIKETEVFTKVLS